MKRSKAITLVLLTGTLLLPACGEEENLRNKYASWDDCIADYKDQSKCARSDERTSTGCILLAWPLVHGIAFQQHLL